MRVLYFTDTVRMGGAERVLEDLARGSVDAGHDVIAVAPQEYVLEHLSDAVDGITTRRWGHDFRERPTAVSRARSLASQGPSLTRMLRELRPDVLHVSNGGHPGSALCCAAPLAARVAGVPRRVLSVHAVPRPRSDSPAPLQALLDRAVWSSTDVVIGATEIVGRELHANRGLPKGRYARIAYGVPEPAGRDDRVAQRTALGVADDDLLAVMLSAASDEQKGHSVLARALERSPGIHAAVAGSAPPPAALELLEASPLSDRVTVLGRIPEVGPLLHAADVIVVPSIADESLPLVVLEAMAAARPVFASRLSGIPEAVEDGVTGRLFEPGDADALSVLLRDAARDRPRLRELGAAAHDAWRTRFSIDAMVGATLRLYVPGA